MLAILFVVNGLLYNIKTPQGMLVISAGLYKETRWQSLTQALIAVILGILLAIPFGLYGIMIALSLSNLYRVIDLLFFIPKNITHMKVSESAVRIIRLLVVSVICFVPSLFIKVAVSNFIIWAVYAIIYTIFIALALTIESLLFDRECLFSLISRIKNTIKSK